jgi:hypothetical protein
MVQVDGKQLTVYKDSGQSEDSIVYDKQVYQTSFTKLWVGNDPLHISAYWQSDFVGNSLLAHIQDRKYVWIGWLVYEFTTAPGDYIVEFHSPVGHSDVPYPYAIGRLHTYLFLEGKYLSNKHLERSADPYVTYYKPTRLQDILNGSRFPFARVQANQQLDRIEKAKMESQLQSALKVKKSAKSIHKKIKVERL